MQSLEKRITALEQSQPADKEKTMFLSFHGLGTPETEIHELRDSLHGVDCQRWTRELHETEEAFKERASREVKRNPERVALLFKTEPTANPSLIQP